MIICPYCKKHHKITVLKFYEPLQDQDVYAFVIRCPECLAYERIRKDDLEAMQEIRFFVRDEIDLIWSTLTGGQWG